MASVRPRPKLPIIAVESLLKRTCACDEDGNIDPESLLALSVVVQAISDLRSKEFSLEAKTFFNDWRLHAWSDAAGLNPAFVRNVAVGAGYLV